MQLSSSLSSLTLSKTTAHRLLLDIRQLHEDEALLRESGIHYVHDETNMLMGYAMIIGQPGTPYHGGFYGFELTFPSTYPFAPPTVICYTALLSRTRFHPNLYTNGKVCLSMLNTWAGEPWSACQSIRSTLLALASLLDAHPLRHEPSYSRCEPTCAEAIAFHHIVRKHTIEVAILHPVLEPNAHPLFLPFRQTIIDSFTQSYPLLVDQLSSCSSSSSLAVYCNAYPEKHPCMVNDGELLLLLQCIYKDMTAGLSDNQTKPSKESKNNKRKRK